MNINNPILDFSSWLTSALIMQYARNNAPSNVDSEGFGGGSGGGRQDVGDLLVDLPESDQVSSPSTADDYSSRDLYDEYLSYLQKGANIGLFSTAQDVADQAQLDRDFQALEAQKERDWYTSMSDTAYQRQVADLEAAGLNPILGFAHSAGSGAAVGATAVPSGRSTNLSAIAPSLADYINAGANLISSAADLLKYFKPTLSSSISDITSRSNVTSRSVSNSTNHNYNYRR